jgi:hypothetical protein
MKSALAGFVLTAALMLLQVGILPSAWPAMGVPQDGGIAERHAHEDKAAVEKELGLAGA